MRDLKNNNNNKIHKTGGLNVMYTNADMLHNKLDEIETIANDENLDIIAVTETLLKNMPPDSKPEDFVFVIKGFNTIYNYNGRGLCLFIKKQIDFNQVYQVRIRSFTMRRLGDISSSSRHEHEQLRFCPLLR